MGKRLLVLAVVALWGTGAAAVAAPVVSVERIQGRDRYETSAALAVERCNGYSPVLASGASWADALSATALAAVTASTTLLVPPDRLHPATAAALDRCRPKGEAHIIIVGGVAAVSADVEQELVERGYTVHRIAGADRYETARHVAASNVDSGCHCSPNVAIVASGEDWPDAAAAGAILGGWRSLLLTARDQLPPATRDHLRHEVDRVYIVGGKAAVSEEVEQTIRSICGRTSEGGCIEVSRLAGENRQATAAAIADFRHAQSPPRHVVLVRGDAFADAVSGGHHALGESSAILLTGSPSELHPVTEAWLRANSTSIASIHVIGDETAVSEQVAEQARRAATTP